MSISSYLPTLVWDGEEVQDAFLKSLVFSVLISSSLYYLLDRLMYSKQEQRSRMICYLIPTIFSSVKLVYAISIWTSTVVQYIKMGNINLSNKNIYDMFFQILTRFQDKSHNIIYFSVFVQFLLIDVMIGQEYYPKTLQNRYPKIWIQLLTISFAFANDDMKWLGFFWLSEYSEVMRYLTLISGYPNDKIDILIYQMTHISFQVIFPLFLMYQIYQREYPISEYLWGILMISQWYEMCMFSFWIIDQIWGIRSLREIKKDMKKE